MSETLLAVLFAWAFVNVLAAWCLSRLGSRLRRFRQDEPEARRVAESHEHEITG
jgi:hypothetical protein